MNTHENESESSRRRRSSIEEEQSLCNEALESGDLDELSDAAWIALCEKAAAKSRKAAPVSGE
ncbi:MAG: hypothetical protein AMXMBFR84_45080 [Candidatus Hydrogenedentota bacterium]